MPSGREVPAISVPRAQAAAALGMSIDSFERYVQPDLRANRRGRLRLFLISDLRAWAEANAAHAIDPDV